MALLQIHNPHSALAALKHRPKAVKRIAVANAAALSGTAWDQVVNQARALKIPVEAGAKKPVEDRPGSNPKSEGRTSAASAFIEEAQGVSLEELFSSGADEPEGLWIALDSLQDPHNVGAIFRTAAFFGVRGIILTQERSAPMSATVYDVASGGVENVPFTMQTNLQRAFEVAKDAGLWVLGTSEHATEGLDTVARDRKWLLVLGNEEKGMRRLTEERCDVLCAIKPRGGDEGVTSLNVSVAAGVLISRLA